MFSHYIRNVNYGLRKFVISLIAGVTPIDEASEEETTDSMEEECEEEEEGEAPVAFSLPAGVSETGSSRT